MRLGNSERLEVGKFGRSSIPGQMAECNHTCEACEACCSRIKRKVVNDLLPLLAKLVKGETDAFKEELLKLQNEYIIVPERWDDVEVNASEIAQNNVLLDGVEDLEQACHQHEI